MQKIVECGECHYEFNYTSSLESHGDLDFPTIIRCPECGLAGNVEIHNGREYSNPGHHKQHMESKSGIKIWLAMLGPIILLEVIAFLSMPLLRISIFLYIPGIAVVAIFTWGIAAVSSVLIGRYRSRAEVVLED